MKLWIIRSLVLGCGLFFLMAGLTKIVDPRAFAESILNYRLTGPVLSIALAYWIPWIEVAAVVALAFRNWRRAGLCLMLALLCIFEVILLSAFLRGLDIDCGCLGTKASTSVTMAMGRNLVLAGIVSWLIFTNPIKSIHDRPPRQHH